MSARQGAGAGRLQAGQVRAMFDRVALVYDPMNTAMTAGLHHRWRARAADVTQIGPGSRVLDVATGTGDLALELASRVSPAGEVIGVDFSERMLDRAREKADALRSDDAGAEHVRPRFEWADAMALPYPDGCFDAVTVAFGARNFDDLGRGLAEMARVLRPGGRLVVLEITTPTRAPLSLFYGVWFDHLVPALGRAAATVLAAAAPAGNGSDGGTERISDAYRYLPNSVKRFPGPVALAGELQRAGLQQIRWLLLAGGIVAIHSGTVRAGAGA